jgi:hypothetical protein
MEDEVLVLQCRLDILDVSEPQLSNTLFGQPEAIRSTNLHSEKSFVTAPKALLSRFFLLTSA